MENRFFDADRSHSRPKRVILRNMLGGIFPYYWGSERATALKLLAQITSPNASVQNQTVNGDNIETMDVAPQAVVASDVSEEEGEGEAEVSQSQLETVRLEQTNNLTEMTQNEKKIETANLNYLDAFAGRGKYKNESVQHLEGDVSEFGSPIIAVEKAVSGLKHYATTAAHKFRRIFGAHQFAVNFIFNEPNKDNLTCLKGVVDERFRLHNWNVVGRESDEGVEKVVYQGRVQLKKKGRLIGFARAQMRVNYTNKEFEKLELDQIPSPLFSFVDPFGIKSIPMEAMEKIIGNDREVFLNLMVSVINRNWAKGEGRAKIKEASAICRLYGCMFPSDFMPLEREEGEEVKLKEKLDWFAEEYFDKLNLRYRAKEIATVEKWDDGFLHTKFAIKKGESKEDTGLIYYMDFASVKLNFIHMAKQAMMKVSKISVTL